MRWILLAALACGALSAGDLVFSEAAGPRRAMDVYPASMRKAPAVIIVPGSDDIETARYCARFLQPAGYSIMILPQGQPSYPASVEEAERAVRFIRRQARKLAIDSLRIGLLGIGSGGLVASLCALRGSGPLANPRDPADRESARVRTVVALAAYSDLRNERPAGWLAAFLAASVQQNGVEGALRAASPVMHITVDAPPFFLIHGDADEATPVVQSTHLQQALKAAGIRCDLLLIPNGGHDVRTWASLPRWENELERWLDMVMQRKGKAQ